MNGRPDADHAPPGKGSSEKVWSAFYHREYPTLARTVFRFGVHGADVSDVIQQVFLIAFDKLEKGHQVEHPRAWLRGIAVRVISDHYRWRRVRRLKGWLLEATTRAAALAPPTDVIVQANMGQERVASVLRKLSPKLRTALVLCDIEECTPREAAEILGVSTNTVRSRRRLARDAFERLWTRSAPRGDT